MACPLRYDAQTELKNLQMHPTETEQAVEYNADVDALKRNSTITVGLAVTSIGLLAGGVYLYLYERRRDVNEGNRAENKTGQAGASRSWASITPAGLFWNGVW